MMYVYKLPNGLTRLSGKAAYYADVSDAYAELAKARSDAHMDMNALDQDPIIARR